MAFLWNKELWKVPLWIYIIALLPRFVVFILVLSNPEYCLTPDSQGYINMSHNLLNHFTFANGDFPFLNIETFRVPGYPVFLTLVNLLPGNFVFNIVFLQLSLSVATVVLGYRWFRQMGEKGGAVLGTIFLSLDYINIMHNPIVLAETLQMFFLVVSADLTWQWLKREDNKSAIYSGVLWSLTSFIKPVSLYLPVILSLFMWRNKKQMVLFLLATYFLSLGWCLRNYIQTGYFSFSTVMGISLIRYPAAGIEATIKRKTWAETDVELRAKIDARYGEYRSDAHKSAIYAKEAIKIISKEPVLMARYLVWGLLKTIAGTGIEMTAQLLDLAIPAGQSQDGFGGGTQRLLKTYPLLWTLQIFYALFLCSLYGLCLFGLYKMISFRVRKEVFFLVVIIAYFFIMASSQGYYRYRLPTLPFMAACISGIFIDKKLITQKND